MPLRFALIALLLGSCATPGPAPTRHGWETPVRMIIPGHPQRGVVEHI